MMHKYAAAQSYAAYLRELGRFSNSNGGTTYDASTSKIIFTFGGTSNFIHETTHGTQFETNDIAFDAQNGSTLAADVFDEIEAYKAQYAYKPKSVSKLESNSTINS
ncbi:MAG TPA: hypothetical protein PLL99_07125, partial [Chitinophagales bacterium]|nr:hypothetical protein [Chitinophagales bacterium]